VRWNPDPPFRIRAPRKGRFVPDRTSTAKEAQKELGVSRYTLTRWCQAGAPHDVRPGKRGGKQYFYDINELKNWLRGEVGSRPPEKRGTLGAGIIDVRIPIKEATERLAEIKDLLGVSIDRFAELLEVGRNYLRNYLYPHISGFKTAPRDIVSRAEFLLETEAPAKLDIPEGKVIEALRIEQGTRRQAAIRLGIYPRTLDRLVKKYGLESYVKIRKVADRISEQELRAALAKSRNNKKEAAKLLKISYSALKDLIKSLGLEEELKSRRKKAPKEAVREALIESKGIRKIAAEQLGMSSQYMSMLVQEYGLDKEFPMSKKGKKISKRRVRNALVKSGGVRKDAAKLLGISPQYVGTLIRQYRLEEEFPRKRLPRRWHKNPYYVNPLQRSKKDVRRALSRAGSKRQEAADLLGISPITLRKYIKRYGLATEFPPKYGRGRPRAATKEQIIQALKESGGVRKDAAKALGITPGGLLKLVNRYGIRGDIPPSRRLLTEDEVFDAMEQTGGDREAAAELIDISPLTIKNFIKLPRFEKWRKPMGGREAITEDELTAALEQANGHYHTAAGILKVAKPTVGKLVKKFDLVDAYPPTDKTAIPKEEVVRALQLANRSRQKAAGILGVHPQTMSHLITKFKLRKRFPPPRIEISREQLIRALIEANRVKTEAAKLLKIGVVKLYELIKEFDIDKKVSLDQLKKLLKKSIGSSETHIGAVYSRGSSYYLAVDDNKLITLENREVIEIHDDINLYEEQSELKTRELITGWGITSDQLDDIVNTYFPRPAKKVPKRRITKQDKETHRAVFRRNPDEDFLEIASEILELNHPYAKDLAAEGGIVYATVRETPWFLNKIADTLEEEFNTAEEAAEELELL